LLLLVLMQENAIKTIQLDLQDIWETDQEAYKKALGPKSR